LLTPLCRKTPAVDYARMKKSFPVKRGNDLMEEKKKVVKVKGRKGGGHEREHERFRKPQSKKIGRS